ncbi:hypothetical protein CDD81_4565 [Ophiocordyceps australis]|uniref:DUF7871 domain-containing protein n=1 Tax=Ophiocordyceps australis TaxID=1399860 RepID=A0A2C5YAJ1_9HYPO|nr:hypothetical protein CDD81_4565 [Ophiocordyceps australis]
MVVTKSSTCCAKDNAGCVCAKQATCSCGKQSALHCTCDKATMENKIQGPRCSCRARPCGSRPAGACTCEKASDGGYNPANEIDFTTGK